MRVPVFYLAHPVGAATPDGVADNLASARTWLKALIDGCPNVAWCVSWLPYLDVLEDSGSNRERGLRDDCEIVRRCSAVVMVGPRESEGMRREAEAASYVIHATGRSIDDVIAIVNAEVRSRWGVQ